MANKPRKTLGEKMILIAMVLVCLVAFSTWMMGGLMARYITRDNGNDSARVAKFNELSITENTGYTYMLIPGVNISKDPVLSFGGSEAACFVFLKLEATGWTTSDGSTYTAANGHVSWSLKTDGWKSFKHSVTDETIYYRYLQPNTALSGVQLITDNTVTVSDNLLNSELRAMEENYPDNLGITFNAYVVQASGFLNAGTDAQCAEAAYDSVIAH